MTSASQTMNTQQETGSGSTWDEAKAWMSKNKLKTVGAMWATVLTGSLAYQWTRPVPTSLKIIHSRVYAQAFTLVALAGAAAVDHFEHKTTTKSELELAKDKIMELERKLESKFSSK